MRLPVLAALLACLTRAPACTPLMRYGYSRDALAKLVAREHSWLVRLARSNVREHAIAEEVAQDGWVQVIRSLSGVKKLRYDSHMMVCGHCKCFREQLQTTTEALLRIPREEPPADLVARLSAEIEKKA